MVVDDIEDLCDLLRLQLDGLGYQVIEASNGREAVELAKRDCPDLILMDLTMPVLDGLSATRMIREVAAMCRVVIVAFSALQSGETRARALAAGCDDFVSKPVGVGQLQDILSRHLPTS
jgi:CheY-like chemotaxis protein